MARLRSKPARPGEAGLAERVRAAHAASRGTYGSPRIARQLGCPGVRHRIARLMRAGGLQGRSRRRFRVVTTNSRHNELSSPDHLAQAPTPSGPDQVWMTDITYIPTYEGWLYVACVRDLWSRRLIGWAMVG